MQVYLKLITASVLAFVLVLLCAGTVLARDPLVGVWQTEPDRKKLTSHIAIEACGAAFCGKIQEAFDTNGQSVRTRHVGRELFSGVQPLGGGRYGNGTVRVPLLNVVAQASMVLEGNRLTVQACKGGICDGQVWTRLR